MFALEHNAAGVDDACLQGLATCFPGAWDEASYEWYLKRPFQARRPDMITARDGTQVVGGLGINYRRLRATDGFHDVGVLTAAWTLPKHQGRGYFRRMVEAAMEICTANGCDAVLSFVVARSASELGLRRIGAAGVPTRYMFLAPDDRLRPPARLPAVRPWRAEGIAQRRHRDSQIAFHYATAEEWTTQFIDRPNRTTMLEVDSGVAVLEQVGTTDRLQFLHAPTGLDTDAHIAMASRAHAAGRHFFSFTTDVGLAERVVAHGLRQAEGAIMILDLPQDDRAPTAAASWSARWHVQPGDRM